MIKSGKSSYNEVNGMLNGHPIKEHAVEDSEKPISDGDIHNCITHKNYDGLAQIFENQEMFKLLLPPIWAGRMQFDPCLVALACKNDKFIEWLASHSEGKTLCSVAYGDSRKSDKENRLIFDLINDCCKRLVQPVHPKTYEVIIRSLYRRRGYEADDMPSIANILRNQPSHCSESS